MLTRFDLNTITSFINLTSTKPYKIPRDLQVEVIKYFNGLFEERIDMIYINCRNDPDHGNCFSEITLKHVPNRADHIQLVKMVFERLTWEFNYLGWYIEITDDKIIIEHEDAGENSNSPHKKAEYEIS